MSCTSFGSSKCTVQEMEKAGVSVVYVATDIEDRENPHALFLVALEEFARVSGKFRVATFDTLRTMKGFDLSQVGTPAPIWIPQRVAMCTTLPK